MDTTGPSVTNSYIEGYYWVLYKDFNIPYVVELRFEKWDHTRDGDRWVILEGDTEIPETEFFKYSFIERIEEPEFPYTRIEIKNKETK